MCLTGSMTRYASRPMAICTQRNELRCMRDDGLKLQRDEQGQDRERAQARYQILGQHNALRRLDYRHSLGLGL